MEVYKAIKEKHYDFYMEKRFEICDAIAEWNYDYIPQLRDNKFLQNYTGRVQITDKFTIILPEYRMIIRTDNSCVHVDFILEEIVIAGSLRNAHYDPLPDTMLEFTLMYGRLPQIPS